MDITANQYPYVAGWTGLKQCLPPKYLEGTPGEIVARLKDPASRAEIRRAIDQGLPGWDNNEVKSVGGWHGVLVATSGGFVGSTRTVFRKVATCTSSAMGSPWTR